MILHRRGAENAEVSQRRGGEEVTSLFLPSPLRDLSVLCASAVHRVFYFIIIIMHIETLKTLCDLIETGSFSKAAALNFVSQSAVSQQVKSLEQRFDQQLIERGQRKGVAPTEAGKIFYAECREILEHYRALEERMRVKSGAPGG